MSTSAVKGVLNNGEHTLIPVMAKMIYSAIWNGERFVLKDGRPLHMVKLVSAVRNFRVNVKYLQINLEDGTGLVRVILWQKQKECTAQRHLNDKCNGNCYIRVIGEVEDYYGVHEIIASDVRPVSSGNEVTHHFLEQCPRPRRIGNLPSPPPPSRWQTKISCRRTYLEINRRQPRQVRSMME